MAPVKPTAAATSMASTEPDTGLTRPDLCHVFPMSTVTPAKRDASGMSTESSEKRQETPWYMTPGDSVGPRLVQGLSHMITPTALADVNRTAPDSLATAMTDDVAQVLLKTVANQINLGKAEEKLSAETEETNKLREAAEREVKAANDVAEKERAEREAMREERDESRRRREALRKERDEAVAEVERLKAERLECAAARREVAELKAFMEDGDRRGSVPPPVYWMGVRDCRAKLVLDNPRLSISFTFLPPNPSNFEGGSSGDAARKPV